MVALLLIARAFSSCIPRPLTDYWNFVTWKSSLLRSLKFAVIFLHLLLEKLRNVIQDFPILPTFGFKAYKHVLLLNKGSGLLT